MKKPVIVLLSVLVSATCFIGCKPAQPGDEQAQPDTEVPVQVGKIIRTTLRGYVTAYGTVEPEPGTAGHPAASARIGSSVPDVVTEVKCAVGQHVDQGTVLFQLDSRTADVAVATAEQLVERQKRLLQVEGTSQKALQDAEQQLAAARAQQSLVRIQSPLAGIVTSVNVRPGEAVDLTTVLAEVMDLNRLVVSASVPSAELAALKSGQTTEVRADKSTTPIPGSLTDIGAVVDFRTGTASVRATLPPDSGLRPGQFVSVRIVSAEHKDCLAVPVESVVTDIKGQSVLAVVANDEANQVMVKTGLREGGLVEVEGPGLQPGDTVVTVGAYGLPPKTKIRVAGP